MTSKLRDKAERDDSGDLVWKRTQPALAGGTSTITTNVTDLLRPGVRKTGNVDHLVIEAELYDERDESVWGGNPARPADSETAREAVEAIEKRGLEPAWRLVENAGRTFP